MAVVLAVQALLFQDGGITAYGVNLLAMGAVAVVVGYATTQAIARRVGGVRGQAAGAVVGAFFATLAGASVVAAALAGSGLYPAGGILPVMLLTHVPIGLLEGALTGAILATVLRWRPDLAAGLQRDGRPVARPVATALGALGIALLIAAFAAPFASALPDGLEATAERLGFAAQARALWPAPAPDYELPLAATLGGLAPALAGLGGTIVAAGLAWALSRGLSSRGRTGHR
jgi:cobalt/nickel transport system permease protein